MAKKNSVKHNATGLMIDRNIPLPTSRNVSPFTQVARDLQVGDSVLVDKAPKSLYGLQKKLKVKFASRKEGDKTRIWRMS